MVEWVAIAISVLALGVSIWTVTVQTRYQRQQTEIQKKVADIEFRRDAEREEESRRARLTAEFTQRGSSDVLRITNHGPAVATDVDILFEDEPRPHGPLILQPNEMPIKRIQAGQSITVLAGLSLQCYPPFDVVLKWTEPDGTSKAEQMTLGRPE